MKIREFRHVDELNRLPKDYVNINEHVNDRPEPFKKRLIAFVIGIFLIVLLCLFLIRMFTSAFG